MNKKTVLVVSGYELGWDCVVGVFEDTTEEELKKFYPEDEYYITEKVLHDLKWAEEMYGDE